MVSNSNKEPKTRMPAVSPLGTSNSNSQRIENANSKLSADAGATKAVKRPAGNSSSGEKRKKALKRL